MNQLSVDSGAGDVVETPLPVEVGGADVMGFTALASKGTRTFSGAQIRPHVCGVQAGRVACWGANDHGQSSTAAGTIVPVSRSLTIDDVHAVAPGADHTCVIYGADRRVTCWGRNDDGQLGNGTAGADVRGPDDRPIAGFDDVCSLSAGERHTCGTRADGSVWCWGSNANRRLGDSGEPSNAPRRITHPDARDARAAAEHSPASVAQPLMLANAPQSLVRGRAFRSAGSVESTESAADGSRATRRAGLSSA